VITATGLVDARSGRADGRAVQLSEPGGDGPAPQSHPLRAIRPLVNAALARLSPEFDRLYSPLGRESIAPEKLLRALLLQAFYSIRSERQLMEQITGIVNLMGDRRDEGREAGRAH
jgi:transposase